MKPHNLNRAQELLSQGRSIEETAITIAKENNKGYHANRICYWRDAIENAVWIGRLRA